MTTDPERAGENSEMESVEDEDENKAPELFSKILNRADVLAALQDRTAPGIEVFKFHIANNKQILMVSSFLNKSSTINGKRYSKI